MANTEHNLHLPRILCLHGGGTNARIFKAQCRVIERSLKAHFRLAYAEAPYVCQPGPDVVSVYAEYGPFKRWLRWLPEHKELDNETTTRDIERNIQSAMDEDDRQGATGPWVGLLGFSQGAKLAASLLFKHQKRQEKFGADKAGSTWRFAVVMAGRAPLVSFDPETFTSSMLGDPSQIGLSGPPDLMEAASEGHILKLPTIHVHGLYDPSLQLHRDLLEDYCDGDSVRVLEWEGGHRVPLKATDVNPLVDYILEIAEETK
jgi:pimeloyl-ACP methyl ester carboxylesterase